MADDHVLNDEELRDALGELPDWEVRDGWLRRTFATPGWPHTMLLASAIGNVAEAAYHPDLSIGYAKVTVKLQTHRVRAVTDSDIELARQISAVVCWQPPDDSPLAGFPKRWVN